MEKEIRFGLIGYGSPHDRFDCGRGGALYKNGCAFFENVTPVAVCDKVPEILDNVRNDLPETNVYTDFDEMLESENLDAVLIGTPATCHAEFSIKALKKNIHVLSEIPCINRIEEAAPLWQAQMESSAFYMTGANPNFWAFVETAVDLKNKGLFGEPYYIECTYIHDLNRYFERTPWRRTYEPIKYSTHSLGPVLRLVDEDLKWVSCFDTGSHINKITDEHDAMAALFRTPSNVVVRLLVSFRNKTPAGGHHYRFLTTKGSFERTPPYRTHRKEAVESARTLFYSEELYGNKNWIELPSDTMRPEYASRPNIRESGHGGADYVMMDHFFKAVRNNGPSPINLREGLRMTLPGLYALESARRGGKLTKIEYPWSKQMKDNNKQNNKNKCEEEIILN